MNSADTWITASIRNMATTATYPTITNAPEAGAERRGTSREMNNATDAATEMVTGTETKIDMTAETGTETKIGMTVETGTSCRFAASASASGKAPKTVAGD
jgi:hypothetical protein